MLEDRQDKNWVRRSSPISQPPPAPPTPLLGHKSKSHSFSFPLNDSLDPMPYWASLPLFALHSTWQPGGSKWGFKWRLGSFIREISRGTQWLMNLS